MQLSMHHYLSGGGGGLSPHAYVCKMRGCCVFTELCMFVSWQSSLTLSFSP